MISLLGGRKNGKLGRKIKLRKKDSLQNLWGKKQFIKNFSTAKSIG
jgi:hypothetical protein